MASSPPPLPAKNRVRAALRNLLFMGLLAGGIGYAIFHLWKPDPAPAVRIPADDAALVAKEIDAELAAAWEDENLIPAGPANELTVMRRVGLALTGAVPSLEEIRHFEKKTETDKIEWWVNRLFDDRRTSAYLAERLARAYVGVENGPFILYRRRRLVEWLDDQLFENRAYDEIVRDLIAAEGIWTTHPQANFLTVTLQDDMEPKKPDPVKLAARTTRAFLGVRIDCMQCHDDMFGDRWKQQDFHQLAAFFGQSVMSLNGVQDDPKSAAYETRFRGEKEPEPVSPLVPFRPDLLPKDGKLRERLARWVTHEENEVFARASVNRVWAQLFNRPMTEEIDSIPLEAPFPAGMETLAADLVEHDFDLQRLIRIIVQTRAFQMASHSADPEKNPVTEAHEAMFAAFPMTRMRPEQVAGAVIQAASLSPLDAGSHIVKRLQQFGETNDFVKRFGDLGEDEFTQQNGTLAQRLLLMNGKLIRERSGENPVMNASTRIGLLTKDNAKAVETAYLVVLSRRPTEIEKEHFIGLLDGKYGGDRSRAMQDIYWALINSTEFSWNH